jgi:hypothetical protein
MNLSRVLIMEAPQSTSISVVPERYNVLSLCAQIPSTTARNEKNATGSTSKRKHTERAASPALPSSALPPAINVDEV